MVDITAPVAFASKRRFDASSTSATPAPLSLSATVVWGAVAILALFSYMLLGKALAWSGTSSRLPAVLDLLPLSHALVLAVVLLAVRSAREPAFAHLGLAGLRGRGVLRAVGLGVACYIGMVVLYIGLGLIKGALGLDTPGTLPSSFVTMQGEFGRLAFLISLWVGMVIAAPIAEELLFRGLLYRGLAASRLGAAGAVILTSVAFGVVHAPGFGWERIVVTGLVGVMLGVVRWRTGNTTAPIVVHATFNVIGALAATVAVMAA